MRPTTLGDIAHLKTMGGAKVRRPVLIKSALFGHLRFGSVCALGAALTFLHWPAIIVHEFTNLQIIKFRSFY